MNILDKVKSYLANFDPNNAFASLMATIASISSEDFLSIVYLLIAAGTFYHNMKMAKTRLNMELRKNELELEKEKLMVEKEKLNNERFQIETDNLKITTLKTKEDVKTPE